MNHGTDSCYTNRKCRCDPCRKAHADKQKRYRQEHGYYDVRARRRATTEAARRYAQEHPGEWCRLLYDETKRARTEATPPAAVTARDA